MIHMRHRRRRRRVDGSYIYESKNPFYRFFAGVLRAVVGLLLPVLAKLWCGYKIRGREHVRRVRGRGVVVVANHVHPLDCITICGCLFRWRKTRFVTLTENMDIPVLGPLIRAYGGLPIAETAAGTKRCVAEVDGLLRGGAPVLFFPEVALWSGYRGVRPFQKGAFTFAVRSGAPVLPVFLRFEPFRFRRGERLVFEVGPPIEPDGLDAKRLCSRANAYFVQAAAAAYGTAEA